jgi:hypothetical protein
MDQEQTTVQPSPPKETSTFSKLMNIFVAPGEVFESIKAKPRTNALWVIPSILAVVLGIFFFFVLSSDPAIESQFRDQISKRVDEQIAQGQVTPDRAEATKEQMMNMTKIVAPILSIILVFASLLVVSLVIFLVGKLAFKGNATYGKVMEVVGASFMVDKVLGPIVASLIMLAMGSIYASPGLALLISGFNPDDKVHILLSSVNIFSIWYLSVLSIGVRKFYDVSIWKAAVWVVALWVLWTLFTTFVAPFLRMA